MSNAMFPARRACPSRPLVRRHPHRPVLVAVFLAATALIASAQDADSDIDSLEDLREQLKAQQVQIDQLLQRLDVHETEPVSLDDLLDGMDDEEHVDHYGSAASFVTVHGFLEFMYADPDARDSSFDLDHANMFFSADLDDYAQAWFEIEYEHSGEEIEVDQAEIRLFGEDITVGLGRFYAPFGIERRTWYPPESRFVSRPDAFQFIVPGNWYETGVRVERTFDLKAGMLETEFSISNGFGATAAGDIRASRQTRDNNTNKALIGRVGLRPTEALGFGVSGATLKYDDMDSDKLQMIGVDIEYAPGPWLLRAEAVRSSVEDPGGPVGDFQQKGLYIFAARELYRDASESFWLTGRLDLLDDNDEVVDAHDYVAYTLGAEWQPRDNMRVRLEGRAFGDRHGSDPVSDSEIRLQFVLDF